MNTDLEQWFRDSRKWLETTGDSVSRWTEGELSRRFQTEWQHLRNRLEEGDWQQLLQRYGDAVQTLAAIYVRTQVFEYSVSETEEAETKKQKEAELHEKNAAELAELCKRQGGAWVKAAQFLSTQGDWLPEVYQKHFAVLQDQAPPASWVTIVSILETEFGSEWKKHFRSIDPQPVATASIAQVHRATLPDASQIALKVQLPDAPQKIEADLKFFELAAHLFASQTEGLNIGQIVSELSKSILLELDYFHEAKNLRRFHENYRTEEWVEEWVFPELIPDLLTTRTLGMNFVEGTSLRPFLAEVPAAADSVLKILLKSFLRQIFLNGLFHADPHPGNFFVTPRGQLALLDFGAVGQLEKEETQNYREVLAALLLKQEADFEKKLERAGFVVSEPEKLKSLLFHKKRDEKNAEQLTQLQRHLRIMREVQVEIPDHFVLTARVLVSIGGLLKQYNVRLSPIELAQILM